jgi:DNA polymerase (family X)
VANEAIADIFLEIADLLDLEGVAFKPEAYRRAARTLQQLPEDVSERLRSGTLGTIPGIGEALSEKIKEFVETGQVHYLTKLREQWPPGLLQLMRLEGIGPKTTRRFYVEFQVQGPEDLDRAIREGKLKGVRGFGERKIELLAKAVAKALAGGTEGTEARRLPLPEAQLLADELIDALKATAAPVDRLVFAGSLRRRKETVGDLDILATSTDPKKVMERFTHMDLVEEVRLSGDTKSTVLLRGGFQVDLRVVPANAFGAALQYFTGSKDHNVHLRSLANQKGLKINEYGLTRDEKLVPAPTEEEVYAAVGLPWIPPEMRENSGEIEAALEHRLPDLIAPGQVLGELHIHIPASFEKDDLGPWVDALSERKMRYAGFVTRAEDLSAAGVPVRELRQRLPREQGGVRVLVGLERTLAGSATSLPEPSGEDFQVLRGAEGAALSKGLLSAPAPGRFLGHVNAETLARSADLWKQLRAKAEGSVPLECAVSADEVVLPTPQLREAVASGVPVLISGLPRLPEELSRIDLAVGIARRAWTPTRSVLNARTSTPFG